MKARVLKSAHSGLSRGMTGILRGVHAGGYAVLFPSVESFDGFTRRHEPATIWCALDDVELLPDDTCDAAFLLSFSLLSYAPPVNLLHITMP